MQIQIKDEEEIEVNVQRSATLLDAHKEITCTVVLFGLCLMYNSLMSTLYIYKTHIHPTYMYLFFVTKCISSYFLFSKYIFVFIQTHPVQKS